MKIKIIIVSILSSFLCACSGFFDKDNTPAPSPLVNFKSEANPRLIWYQSTGSGVGDDYLKLVPALTDKMILTADKNGTVVATDKMTGKLIWQTRTNLSVASGPGVGDGLVLVGGRDGQVIALHQMDGSTAWKSQASTEILAPAAIDNGVALVKSIDGRLTAFTDTGASLWSYQQNEPAMMLRSSSTPLIHGNAVVAGFANSNLAKLTLHDGSLIWQQTIVMPEGSFAIQRMVDIDADPVIAGNHIYVATYQGKIAALDLNSGRNSWSHDISSYTGITADNKRVYVSDARGHVWAFDSESGTVDWHQSQLEARNVTGPAVVGDYVVVGDAEGYLHWLSKEDGHFVARVKVNSSGILASPVVDNGMTYVLTKNGYLAAYSIQ